MLATRSDSAGMSRLAKAERTLAGEERQGERAVGRALSCAPRWERAPVPLVVRVLLVLF